MRNFFTLGFIALAMCFSATATSQTLGKTNVQEKQARIRGEEVKGERVANAVFPFSQSITTNVATKSQQDDAFLESFSGAFPPTGWEITGTPTRNWMSADTYATTYADYGGDYVLDLGDGAFAIFDCFYENTAGKTGNLVSPDLNITASASNLLFDVTEILLNSDYIDVGMQLYVDIYTTTWTNGTNNVLTGISGHNTASVAQTPTTLSVNLAAYAGTTIKVRFRAVSDYGAFSLALDNVRQTDEEPSVPAATAVIQGLQGGLWSTADSPAFSGTGNKQLAYAGEQIHYFGTTTNANSASWSFSGSPTAVTNVDSYKHVTVGFNDAGTHTATLSAEGDGGNGSAQLTTNLAFPVNGSQAVVWNYSASDQLFSNYYTTDVNNYLFGINGYYKRIAEVYQVPADVTVRIQSIGFIVAAYNMNSTNQAKAVTIRIGKVGANGAPGEVVATITPTFATLFGTTIINSTTGLTSKAYTLATPVTIEGSFYIDVDFSSNTNTISATNLIGLTANTARAYAYSNSFAYYSNTWRNVSTLFTNGNYDAAIMPGITYMPVVAKSHTPASNAVGVTTDASVTVTYNQTVTAADLTGITINSVAASASVSGAVLTINHATFDYNTEYTVVVPAGTITGVTDALTWKFTTQPDPTACNAPLNFTYSNITYTTVDLAWQETGPANAWEVKYGAAGFNPDEAGTSVPAATNPFTLEGLTHNTTYDIYVRSVCSESESGAWSAKVTVTTPLDCTTPIDLPITENFDSALYGCWTAISNNTQNQAEFGRYNAGASIARSGTYVWRFSSYNTATDYKQYLITPLLPAGEKSIEFYHKRNSTGGVETFKVGYSTTDNDPSSFTWCNDPVSNNFATSIWTKYDNVTAGFAIPENAKYIAIQYTSIYQYRLYIDDIHIDVALAPVSADVNSTILSTSDVTDIPLSGVIEIKFTKAITLADGSGVSITEETGKKSATAAPVDDVTVSGSKLQIVYSDLTNGTNYTLLIPAGTVTGYDLDIEYQVKANAPTAIPSVSLPEVVMYPNPSNGVVFLSSLPENATISLLDLSGRKLQTYRASGSTQLNLKVAPGIYFVRIQGEEGKAIVRKLIVK
ncbi:MAG: T9SS type A sorting domain-containing protein [Dysgonamonadaceae bacterium]|jgi:hypothetical protein|nr:T9SS type A sorting domain-containing protein [Dysgonamonadaceae bacterium]